MLELYQSYVGYEEMMTLAENLIAAAAKAVGAEMAVPFKRATLFGLLKEHTGMDLEPAVENGTLLAAGRALHLDLPDDTPDKKVLDTIFDEFVQKRLTEPTFVIDYPTRFSPLSKSKPERPGIAERFELFMNGKEIANAYSELNDPEEQRRRFTEQVEARTHGDDEAQLFDDDYLTALEHGMPPAGGLGIGIDRLAMILTGAESIREVILFPTLRNKTEESSESVEDKK
jgi:lysyl-tRNA synthetase class 2